MPQLHRAAFKDNGKKKMTMDDYGYLGAMWLLHELKKKIVLQMKEHWYTTQSGDTNFLKYMLPATHVIKGDIGNGVHNHPIFSKRRTQVISHFSTPHAANDKIHTMVIGTQA